MTTQTLTGVVLNGAHGIYDVHTDEGTLRCTLRGKLKKAFAQAQSTKSISNTRVRRDKVLQDPNYAKRIDRMRNHDSSETPPPTRLSVGDHVKLRRLDDENGLIEETLPRQSSLSRRDAGSTSKKVIQQTMLANLDQVVLVFAIANPEPHFAMVDRYLTICESAELHAILCLNKSDLPHTAKVEDDSELYSKLGYTVLWTSTHTGQGIDH